MASDDPCTSDLIIKFNSSVGLSEKAESCVFFHAEDGIRDPEMSRGLGDVYKRQKQRMSGLLAPDVQEKITGTAQILEIFKVSGAGKIAGSKVTEGEINSTSDVRIIRDGVIIYLSLIHI